MRRFLFLLLTIVSAVTAKAQLNGDGYYRVQNNVSSRYIYVTDNTARVDKVGQTVEFHSLQTKKPFNRVVADPASVIYIQNAGGSNYTLKAQGTDTYTFSGYYLQLEKKGSAYWAYGVAEGNVRKYLIETDILLNPDDIWSDEIDPDNGQVTSQDSKATDTTRRFWRIIPVTQADEQYFGVTPSVQAGGSYWQTFYADFPFSFVSSGNKAYYVKTVDASLGVAVMAEISGTVPAATPVILQCASNSAAQNKMTLGGTGSSVSGNKLLGVYFDREQDENMTKPNLVAYDKNTMRLIGKTSDGKIGFVTSTVTKVPRNTAYLKVASGTPSELRLVTQAEYDQMTQSTAVTIKANDASRLYGDANPTFTYTVTSGTKQGGEPSLTCDATATSPVGTYPIKVAKGGVTNTSFTGQNGTLTVTKAPLTITAKSYTIKQNEPLPTFAADYSGFKNGETSSVLSKQPTFSCNAPADKTPGTYAITVSGAEAGNYNITYVAGTLTIQAAPQITLKAEDKSRVYGEENPQLTYTVTGGTVSGTPTLSTTAVKTSPVGTYPITIAAGSVSYPNLQLTNGTLTVTKAALTITAKSYTIKQNEPLPTFAADYSGFKNGETSSVLSKQPTFSCNVPADKTPGTYAITVSGAEASNYNITYVAGTLTIVDADPITITANSHTMEYGGTVPELTYTVSGGSLTGTPVLTCEASSTSDVGTYTITVAKGSVDYPNLKLVSGTLTITKAPVTVTAQNQEIDETAALPAFAATYAGFKNGQTESVLTQKPGFTCTPTAAEIAFATYKPGEYAIVPSGAEAKNYSFTYNNGTLKVTAVATLTVTAKNAEMVYGDAVPTLTYTVSNGTLPEGVLAITTSATKTSHAGAYDIVVSRGTSTYPRLTFVNGQLTVKKAPLTVSAGNYSMKQNAAALPAFKATYSGFKNDDSEASLDPKPTFSTTASVGGAIGDYAVVVSGAGSPDYDFTYVNGTLSITEADAITIVIGNKTMVYGDEVPTFTYTIDGTVEGTPRFVCAATSTSPVGEYDITLEEGSVTYYNLKVISGKLTITPAPLTIKANDVTMSQIDQRPAFTATFTGFKNGETEAVLTKQPVFSTDAPEDNTPGQYVITVSDAEAANYAITYTNGQLTITAASLITITAVNATMVYGDELPELTYTVEGGTITGVPELTVEADKTSDVGTYQIVVKAGTVNYPNLKFVAGMLTITKAPLTVSVGNYEREEGQPNPTFVLSYEGWRNGDTEAVLTQKPVVTTEATEESLVGEYEIVVSGGEAKNYSFTYVNGKLTVNAIDGIATAVFNRPVDVYTMTGRKVRSQVTTLQGLPAGVYIVNGRKMIVK